MNNNEVVVKKTGAGRPKGAVSLVTKSLRELATPYCPAAILVLVDIMEDATAPHAARKAAATELLDRGYGKAMQSVELSGPNGEPIQTKDVTQLSTDRLMQIAQGG